MVPSVVHETQFDPTSWYKLNIFATTSKILIFYTRWISEKYDGFRACWNYIDSQMYSEYYLFTKV